MAKKWISSLTCKDTGHKAAGYSYNWAGYQAPNTTAGHAWYTTAGMDWTVPPAVYPPASQPTDASIWAGIGAGTSFDDQLIQSGSISNSGPGFAGIGDYSGQEAFFELYPAENEQVISQLGTLTASGHISTTVTYDLPSNTAYWVVCNATTCASISQQLQPMDAYAFPTTSEWIVERDSLNGNFTALAPFANGTITNAGGSQQEDAGNFEDGFVAGSASMPASALTPINMHACAGQTLATTGPITANGTFTVTWDASGKSESC